MTTTINPELVRATLVGRVVPQAIRAVVRLATQNSITAGTTLGSLSPVDVLFHQQESVVNGNLVLGDTVAMTLRNSLLFSNISLTSGSTYYVVAYAIFTSRQTWIPINTVLWSTSFVAGATLSNQLLLLDYPNNVIGTL